MVNNMAPRNPSVCAACSRPLERGYLHDLSTSRRLLRGSRATCVYRKLKLGRIGGEVRQGWRVI